MATTRNAVPIQEVVTWHGAQRILKLYGPSAGIAIAAADVTTINNVVQLFTVPKGFTVTGVRLDCTRLDSNGSPTLTLDIGDATTTNRLVQASTIAQAAESQVNPVLPAGVLGFKFPADTVIQMLVHAAAATPAAGTLILMLEGFIDA
jgi:hypothetical protein